MPTGGLHADLGPPTSRVGSAIDRRVLRWLGRHSYGIYVFHRPPFLVAERLLPTSALPTMLGYRYPALALYVTGLTLASSALAWVSWHAYEKHFLRLEERFPTDPGAAGPPAPAADALPGRAVHLRVPDARLATPSLALPASVAVR